MSRLDVGIFVHVVRVCLSLGAMGLVMCAKFDVLSIYAEIPSVSGAEMILHSPLRAFLFASQSPHPILFRSAQRRCFLTPDPDASHSEGRH